MSLRPVLWQSESKYALYMHELTEPTDCELVLAVSGGQSLLAEGFPVNEIKSFKVCTEVGAPTCTAGRTCR